MGFGSRLGHGLNDLRPQDVFSWSSPGVRNLSSSGTRYFSINSGSTNIVNFSQNPNGDFGDWLSTACPQAHPYVQNAFGCRGQSSDVRATSPEGINLDCHRLRFSENAHRYHERGNQCSQLFSHTQRHSQS
jgi:hypothetical protein